MSGRVSASMPAFMQFVSVARVAWFTRVVRDVRSSARAAHTGQVLKAALAGVVAWYLCQWGGLSEQPYPAALAALLCVRSTVLGSVSSAVRYAGGCVAGALIALPVAYSLGPNWLGLAIVLLLSGLLAGWERFGAHGMHIPATALFVLVLSRGELLGRGEVVGELLPHVADIVVGAAVGVAFNLLHAPVRLRSAEAAADQARRELAAVLRGLGTALAEGRSAHQHLGRGWWEPLSGRIRRARSELDQARESVRWNPRIGARRARRRLDEEAVAVLERLADHAGEIARVVDRVEERAEERGRGVQRPDAEFRERYARLLNSTALCVGEAPAPSRDGQHALLGATRRGWEGLVRETDLRHRGPGSGALAVEGRLLLLLDRALADLGRS